MQVSPYIISWNVSRRCNLACSHCYLPASTGEATDASLSCELDAAEALRVIDQIADVNHEVMLILSGGEPLLRRDIFELAAYASGKGMMVVLGSNGLLIDDGVASDLRRSGVSGVSISIDSVSPEIHDGIRSFEGAWEKAVAAVGICKSRGLSVQVNAVVTRKNYEELQELVRFAARLGAKVFSPFFLVCTGRGEELSDISPRQYQEVLSFVVKSGGKCGDMMIRTRCAPTFRKILYENDSGSLLLKMDTGRCLAGTRYCRITSEGEVTPCPYMPLSLGNLKERAFRDIWENSEILASLRRPLLRGKCGICEFRLICGGCRARAYASSKDYLSEDQWCAFVPGGGPVKQQQVVESSVGEGPAAGSGPRWTEEAEERLKRVPFFVRFMVRGSAERYAEENGYRDITPELLEELRKKAGRMGVGH